MKKPPFEIYHQMFESVTDAMVSLDYQWRCVHLNRAASEMLGIAPHDSTGRILWEVAPWLKKTRFPDRLSDCLQKKNTEAFECFFDHLELIFECHCYAGPDFMSILLVDITAKKRHQLLSKASSRNRVMNVIEEAQGGFWDMPLEYPLNSELPKHAFISPKLLQILGYTLKEWTDTLDHWLGIMHPDDAEMVRNMLSQHLQTSSRHFGCEYRIRHRQGSYRWFYSRGDIPEPSGPGLGRWLIITLDITDRKQEEEESARMAAIAESSHDAIIGHTLHGHVTTWNPGAERLYGYGAEEVMGKNILESMAPPDCFEHIQTVWQRVINGERIEPFETKLLHKNGMPQDVLITFSQIIGRNNRVMGVSSIHSDLTKVNRMQREQEQLNRTLQSVMRAFPDILWVVDSDRMIRYRNTTAASLFGKSSILPQLPEKFQKALNESISSGEDYMPSDFMGVEPMRIQGQDRHFLCRLAAMKSKKGQLEGIVVILQDVSEFRMLDEVKSNLIGTVSHELKTPVTSIRMSLLLLLEQEIGELNAAQKELVSVARDEVERLLSTLRTLLDLTRFEEGGCQLIWRRIRIHDWFTSLEDQLKPSMMSRELTLKTDIRGGIKTIEVDYDRMTHAVENLLTNALKHSPHNGMVHLIAEPCGKNAVRISVIDQGPGVPEKNQARIFEKFYKTPGNHKDGSGLGLAIAKQFVEAHNGRISMRNIHPNGCRFEIVVPKVRSERDSND